MLLQCAESSVQDWGRCKVQWTTFLRATRSLWPGNILEWHFAPARLSEQTAWEIRWFLLSTRSCALRIAPLAPAKSQAYMQHMHAAGDTNESVCAHSMISLTASQHTWWSTHNARGSIRQCIGHAEFWHNDTLWKAYV